MALLLSACEAGEEPQPATVPGSTPGSVGSAAAPAKTPPASSPGTVSLSLEGYGPVRIGMTPAEVERALGTPLQLDSADSVLCRYGVSSAIPGVRVMIENDRVARIDLAHDGAAQTDKGLGLGDSAAQVRAAYGSALQESLHKYLPPPAGYLESWNAGETRGVRYEIDAAGRVTAVYAGGPAVRYVEGCA